MIPAIVTLIVGVAIVIVSFFLTDGPKENTENSVMDESRENLEKKLDEYCNSLVEKKKNELKKQGEAVKSDMKKGLDEVRESSKKDKGKKIAKNVRCIIFPGTQQIWLDAMHEGLFDIFIEAGAVVSTPTCGPCLGGHMGILAAGERAISTTNRNFVGRMGHVDSEVYLASPAVAAASAVAGYIIDPEKV